MSVKVKSGVVTGGDKRRLPLGPRARLMVIAFVSLLLVAGVTTFAAKWYSHRNNEAKYANAIKAKSVTQVQSASDVKAFKGDVPGAVKDIQIKLDATTNKSERAVLYTQIAAIYLEAKQYDNAATAAISAANEDVDYGRYGYVGRIYEQAGNKTKAIEYYNKSIALYEKDDSLAKAMYVEGDSQITEYQAKVKELSGE